MSVYRFRVSFEDNEEIYREIEIKSLQNFEDFHTIILSSIGFDNKHQASFFISDDYWRKGDEITLKPVDDEDNKKRKREEQSPKKQMSKCKMASLIDDPHQKFVYVYDPNVSWTLLVELIKILPDDAKVNYPRISKSVDDAPIQYKKNNFIAVEQVEEEFDEDEEEIEDDDAYSTTDVDDGIAELEGEEGETEEELSADDLEASDFEEYADELPEED
ncbi:MAG: hypothetical protein WCP52_02450 [Bacteroidota bacterium]